MKVYAASFKGTLSYSEVVKKQEQLYADLKADGVRIEIYGRSSKVTDGFWLAEYHGEGSVEGQTDILILDQDVNPPPSAQPPL